MSINYQLEQRDKTREDKRVLIGHHTTTNEPKLTIAVTQKPIEVKRAKINYYTTTKQNARFRELKS